MFLRFKTIVLIIAAIFSSSLFVFGQETKLNDGKKENKDNKPKKEEKKDDKKNLPANGNFTAEQIAESSIIVFGGFRGRDTLNQIRKTTIERGKISILAADGKTDTASYQRWIIRGDNLEKEKNRLEQEFPNVKFGLIYDGAKYFGMYNNSVFSPREDAVKSFQNQIWHGLDALLRYKENESKLDLTGREKIQGVDVYILDVTDKQNRKTKFYISAKSFNVKMLEYEEDGTKYRRKFYDYNYSQGTLVPYRTVLYANDKQIEETEVGTITYGQKVDDALFLES
ncbi:MAG TPA: hypothetical protein PKY59_21670 [Pyrinomonadaceae bacterium]|nr:hypothetical protein [Pyrinomonadaceae bacterium]